VAADDLELTPATRRTKPDTHADTVPMLTSRAAGVAPYTQRVKNALRTAQRPVIQDLVVKPVRRRAY